MYFRSKRRTDQKPGEGVFSAGIQAIITRIAILVLASGIVALVWYSIIGEPSLARLDSQNEIARFNPSLVHGMTQLLGEVFLLAIVAFIARKWLRVRL